MGKRGPPPTPTPILQLRGSWRGKLNRDEPQPEPVAPEKPSWLTTYASHPYRAREARPGRGRRARSEVLQDGVNRR
jgi:hypothetical protein